MRRAVITALVLVSTSASAQGMGEFDRAKAALDAGRAAEAVGLFHQMGQISDPGLAAKSDFYLAESLAKAGLPVTASAFYADLVRQGPGQPFYLDSVKALVELQERLDDPFLIPSVLHKEFREEWGALPGPARSRLYYLVALMKHRELKLEEARQLLLLVGNDSPVYGKARYLLAVVVSDPRFPGGPRLPEATAAFEEVIKLQGAQQQDLADLRQLAALGLGRLHYGAGKYDQAIASYDQVPRFSRYWDQALFELGFARFRGGDFGGALGALQALHAPQFESAFQPESWLLKATVYYFNCLYNEAATAMKAFADIYNPMADQMRTLVNTNGENYDAYFRMLTDPKDGSLPRQVKLWVRNNERIADLFKLLTQIDREQKRVTQIGGPAQGALASYLEQNRQVVVQTAGRLVRNRLAEATENIVRFNQDGSLIRFETVVAEKKLLEEGIDQRKILAEQTLFRPGMPGDEYNYWQFQGEFWIDEIGYYQYTLKRGCPELGAEAQGEPPAGKSAPAAPSATTSVGPQ